MLKMSDEMAEQMRQAVERFFALTLKKHKEETDAEMPKYRVVLDESQCCLAFSDHRGGLAFKLEPIGDSLPNNRRDFDWDRFGRMADQVISRPEYGLEQDDKEWCTFACSWTRIQQLARTLPAAP